MTDRALAMAGPAPATPARDQGLRRRCDEGHHVMAGEACSRCAPGGALHRRTGAAPPPGGGLPAAVLGVLRRPGLPLDPAVRAFIAPRLGRDFSAVSARSPVPQAVARADDPAEGAADRLAERVLKSSVAPGPLADLSRVRIHTDDAAAAAARSVGARAFAAGDAVVFGAGEYRPQTTDGRRLIAHELAHVGQGDSRALLFRTPLPGQPGGVAEPVDPPKDPDEEGKAAKAQGPAPAPAPGAAASAAPVGPAAPPGQSAARGATPAPGLGPPQAAVDGEKQPQAPGDLPSSDLALIDTELAEHERWGGALETVGAAGSQQRAAFVAQSAGAGSTAGLVTGFKEGAVQSAKMHAGMKVAEKLVEKVGAKVVVKLGAQAARFTPLPGIGAMVGGYMAAVDLVKNREATLQTLKGFGTGSDIYEQLANSIDSISAGVQTLTQVANIIAGVLGAITVIMWAVAVATAGAVSPVALTLTTIAVEVGAATMLIDAINAVVLKDLVTTFRALHGFASDADPRDVQAQGEQIEKGAEGIGGFAGGALGGKAVEGGAKGLSFAGGKIKQRLAARAAPAAASGQGPHVTAEPPAAAKAGEAAPAEAAPRAGEAKAAPPAANEPKLAAAEPAPAAGAPPPGEAAPVAAKPPPAPAAAPPGEIEVKAAPAAEPLPTTGEAPAIEGGAKPAPAVAAAPPREIEVKAPPVAEAPPAAASPGPEANAKGSPAEPAAAAEPPGQTKAKQYGPVDERSFAELNDVIAAKHQGEFGQALQAEQQQRAVTPATPKRSISKRRARQEANRGARRARRVLGMTDPEVQAGHTQAARHTPESGAPNAQVNNPSTFQQLHSRRGRGLDVEVTEPSGQKSTGTRHTTQELLIDDAVGRARAKSGGVLTPEGQAAAGQEVLWRTEGTGYDQREVQAKRASGLIDERVHLKAALDKSPAVQAYRAKKAQAAKAAVPEAAASLAPPAGLVATGPTAAPVVTAVPVVAESGVAHPTQPVARAGTEPPAVTPPVAPGGVTTAPATVPAPAGETASPAAPEAASEAGPRPRMRIVDGRLVDLDAPAAAPRLRVAAPDQGSAGAGPGEPAGPPRRLRIIDGQIVDVDVAHEQELRAHEEAEHAGRAAAAPRRRLSGPAADPAPAPAPAPPPRLPPAAASEAEPVIDPGAPAGPEPRSAALSPKPAPTPSAGPAQPTPPVAEAAAAAPPPSASPQGAPAPGVAPTPAPPPAVAQTAPAQPAPVQAAPAKPAAAPPVAAPPVAAPPTAGRATPAQDRPPESKPGEAPPATAAGGGGLGAIGVAARAGSGKATEPKDAGAGEGGAPAGPITERVNPAYQAPPATPEDLDRLRNQIIDTLGARADAERFGQLMGQQEAHHAGNEKPLEDIQKGNAEAITATKAHEDAIQRRNDANGRKQEHEDKAKGKLEQYSDKAGQLVTLTVPLKAVAGFTGLASHLPEEPDIVARFKRGLLKVNADASRFLRQLDAADQAVADQKTQQAARAAGIKTDLATLDRTKGKADHAGRTFDAAKATAEDFTEKNKQRKEDAHTAKGEAQKTAAALAADAKTKEGQAVSLAAAMQFWANGHKQARLAALEATRKRLEAQGLRITAVVER